ncbi:unnamed protein product, partial [Echinostoma caproni]|uniref:Ig-like domain-containing protein n=1 Tax=Echinostoma caproni TaxID=27848 RepID=A0A183AG48_9TREM
APVAIHATPEPTTVVEGESAVLTCTATGSPGLHLAWKPKNSATVLNETHVNQSHDSEGRLDLILDNVQAAQHGEVYVCEARTSYPLDAAPARAEFVLDVARNDRTGGSISVSVPPTINSSTSTIYTDFHVPEEVNITVTGYPVPDVTCENLELDPGTEVASQPQGGVMIYRLGIPSIKETHLRRYVCKAENPFGVAILPVEFTLAPSNPEVLSPSQTKYADYYLLKWKTHSGAPLVNATLNIEEYMEDESTGNLYPRAALNKSVTGHRVHTVALGLHELDRMNADVWPSPDAQVTEGSEVNSSPNTFERERTVWHHLTNLSANTEHRLTVTVCNEYACGESKPYLFRTN